MLDLMGLLLRPTSGSLYIDDIDTSKLGDRELARMRAHRVGFVFQEYNLLSGLNVLENVMLPLRYVKDGKSGQAARCRAHRACRAQRPDPPPPDRALRRPGAAGGHREINGE